MTSDTSCRLPGCCVARCRKKRNRGSKHVEKTLPQTFQNEAPGGQKWKPTWFQNGSKMAPKMLQNGSLEASGRPLGPTLQPDAPRSRPGEALARPGASQKINLGGLGTPLERKVDRFRPPGGSPGGSRRGSGRSFGELFGGWAGGKKKQKSHQQIVFLELFLHAFSYRSRVCSVRLGARRRESTT